MCSGGGPTLLKVVTAKSMNYFFQDWHRHETSLIKIVLSPPSFTLNNSFFLFLSSVSTKSIIYIYFFINPNNSFFRSQPTLQICTTTYLVIIPHVPAGCSKIQMKVWREKTLEAVLLLCMMFLSSSVQPQELFFLPGKNQEAADGESVILIRGNFVLQRRSRRLSILIFQRLGFSSSAISVFRQCCFSLQ